MPIVKNLEHFNKWIRSYPFYNNVKKEGVELYGCKGTIGNSEGSSGYGRKIFELNHNVIMASPSTGRQAGLEPLNDDIIRAAGIRQITVLFFHRRKRVHKSVFFYIYIEITAS